jgi:glycolate oxidase FAD binding subunit
LIERLADRIRQAAARRTPLRLRGGGSKDFYGNTPQGELLDTTGYAGVVSYDPTELVITARCGTLLSEIEKTLGEQNQFLPFEPPHFGAGATLGGCIAAGLSGPRRASAGSLRDFLLGTKLIDGRGRVLSFGGQVMKNVAGYDVSRVLAGSLGTLGLIAEASLKVLPRPQEEATLRVAVGEGEALTRMNAWAGQPVPLSATCWHDGALFVRLSGAAPAVRAAATKIGGDTLADAPAFWSSVREHTHPFFGGAGSLWRLAVSSIAAPLELPGRELIEWGGALRWIRTEVPAEVVRQAARAAGGHATLFRGTEERSGVFTPLDPVILRLHRTLKEAFDPSGVFNPGRMYAGL